MNEQSNTPVPIAASLICTGRLSKLDPSSLEAVMTDSLVIESRRGDVIDAQVGLVLSGAIALETTISSGRRALAELFHTGDLVDLRRHERMPQGKLVALADSVLMALEPDAFDRCIATHGDLATTFVTQLEDQVGRMRDHASDLAIKTPLERIVSTLFELKRWPGVYERENHNLHLPLLRRDIADYAGMKPETVSRSLRRLLTAGLIQTNPNDLGSVQIVDTPSLRLIANGGAPRGSCST